LINGKDGLILKVVDGGSVAVSGKQCEDAIPSPSLDTPPALRASCCENESPTVSRTPDTDPSGHIKALEARLSTLEKLVS
jgi:hypothetical protein